MKKSFTLFFIALLVISTDATEQNLEVIATAKRLLKLQTELLENTPFFNISYVANLITMNKENLALIKDTVIQPNLISVDIDLDEALSALKELQKVPYDNHTVTPREKIKFFDALHNANRELQIIDETLRILSTSTLYNSATSIPA